MKSLTEESNQIIKSDNPFFPATYPTPFQLPPFNLIQEEHFMPAFATGMDLHAQEIRDICENPAIPSFENTIVALEHGGELLSRVSSVFFNLSSANTSPEIEKIAQEIAPRLSHHGDDIYLNTTLFEKVKQVNETATNLTSEQKRLLEKTYKAFVRSGANLDAGKQEKMRAINKELSVLTVRFGQNLLSETNQFELLINDPADLAGLPESVISSAAQMAAESNQNGQWKFTLHNPSLMPFLHYAANRTLREKMYTAYTTRCNHDDELDNKEIVAKIIELRASKANLLGYGSHADYVLEESMAKTPEKAYELLNRLWKAALPVAKNEAIEMQKVMNNDGNQDQLEGWDWFYYSDQVRREKYNYDAEALRPYFKLENVRDGIFAVAKNLYGIEFSELKNVPKYHDDVKAYEVKEADGTHIGIIYMDFFTRKSKRGGAWMTSYRRQSVRNGQKVSPVISIVCNYSKPVSDAPVLLTPDETETFFHEFGHALHGLLSNVTYESLAGTSVPRDFVELPSQIMEHWAFEPEVLKVYAKHWQTGETIPDDLLQKMKKASVFNQGFATVEYLAASILDMRYHTLPAGDKVIAGDFEEKQMQEIGLIGQIAPRYRSTYFQHIFSGGYSAGYYSYIWSEVLDSDAFAAYKEAGSIFDSATANSFRKNILEKGGTAEPMDLYKAFRGKEPDVKFLLENRGLK